MTFKYEHIFKQELMWVKSKYETKTKYDIIKYETWLNMKILKIRIETINTKQKLN